MTDSQRARQGYSASNMECACIIAANPAMYPEGSLPALWADVVLSRAVDAKEANAMPLFAAA